MGRAAADRATDACGVGASAHVQRDPAVVMELLDARVDPSAVGGAVVLYDLPDLPRLRAHHRRKAARHRLAIIIVVTVLRVVVRVDDRHITR